MGSSDAINAMRSQSVANSSFLNTLSESMQNSATTAQATASTIRTAQQNSENQLASQLQQYNDQNAQVRNSARNVAEGAMKMVFDIINLILSCGSGAVGAIADTLLLVKSIEATTHNVAERDRHLAGALTAGEFVCEYEPQSHVLAR